MTTHMQYVVETGDREDEGMTSDLENIPGRGLLAPGVHEVRRLMQAGDRRVADPLGKEAAPSRATAFRLDGPFPA